VAEPHVLLLEDEPLIRGILLEIFRLEGFEVTLCTTLGDLRAGVAADPAAVVVSDSWDPVHRELLPAPLRDAIVAVGKLAPVILIGADAWTAQDGLAELGVRLLPKPFDLDDLLDAVRLARVVSPSPTRPLGG
jgi:DNA-binding NtrC family response regulator